MELNDKNRSKSKNSKKISSKSVRIHEFGRNPKRYLIGMIYIALNILVGLSSNPLTPIAVTVSKAYNVDIQLVNSTSAVYFFINALTCLPCLFVLRKLGLSNSIRLAAFLIASSFFLRLLIEESIFFVIGGQVLAGISGPFFLTTQIRVISQWFDERERGIWITIISLASPLGVLLCNFVLIFFIDTSPEGSLKKKREQIFGCLLVEAISAGVVFALTLIFWRDGASRGTVLRLKKEKEYRKMNEGMSVPLVESEKMGGNPAQALSLMDQVKHVLSRKYLVLVIINFGFSFGLISGSGALLTEIIHSIGYEEKYGGISNIGSILCGATSSLLFGCFIMKKQWQFKGMVILVFLVLAFEIASLFIYMSQLNIIFVLLINIIIGVTIFPVIPMTLEEMLSRLNPHYLVVVNVILQTLNQIVTMGTILLGGLFFKNPSKEKTQNFQFCLIVAYGLLFILNICIRFLGRGDATRPSVVERYRTKKEIVERKKYLEKINQEAGEEQTNRVEKLTSGRNSESGYNSQSQLANTLGTSSDAFSRDSHPNQPLQAHPIAQSEEQ